jgi:hypothetical protein
MIIGWAMEHPGFAGCRSQELKKFCDKDKCFYHEFKSRKTDIKKCEIESDRK